MRISYLFFTLILLQFSTNCLAAYYDTLPRGVRAFVYKHVATGKISSSFTGNQQEQDYNLKISIDAKSLESLNDIFAEYLISLRKLSQPAYDAFQLGEYEVDANAQVQVQGVGIAYGFSNDLTAYLAFPYHRAEVNLNIERTQYNNNDQVRTLLETSIQNDSGNIDSATAEIITGITNGLPDISGGAIQSVVTNYLGYKPIGSWSAQGMGDLEMGLMYNIFEASNSGMATTFGLTLPTGRTDDPDIIQDIAFGDGQFDVFSEIGGGITIPNSPLSFEASGRYTYQAPSSKTLRIPESSEYLLGFEKATFFEKLGDMVDLTFTSNYDFSSWISTSVSYLFNYTAKSIYESDYSDANQILSTDTEKNSHSGKFELSFSTVELYKKKKFIMPFIISSSVQKTISGTNVPNYSRADINLKLFF